MKTPSSPPQSRFSNRKTVGIVLIVFFMAQSIGTLLSEEIPASSAYNVASRVSGVNRQQLSVDSGGSTGHIVGRTAYLTFRVNGDPDRRITVRLAKIFHFLPWLQTEYVDRLRPK